MVPHHEQAIEMSDLLLAKNDVDPAAAEFARQIKAAQEPEIAQLRGWLQGWGVASMPAEDHGHHGGGMLSEAQIEVLRSADGIVATKLYLSGMIEHHQGAIAMAEVELVDGENADARRLAEQIIASQRSDIAAMDELRRRL